MPKYGTRSLKYINKYHTMASVPVEELYNHPS